MTASSIQLWVPALHSNHPFAPLMIIAKARSSASPPAPVKTPFGGATPPAERVKSPARHTEDEDALLPRRLLVVDMGAVDGRPRPATDWRQIGQTQREVDAGVVLVCGVPFGEYPGMSCAELFPDWPISYLITKDCALVALCHPRHWRAASEVLDLHHGRRALCLQLQRVTASSDRQEPSLKIMLTKLQPDQVSRQVSDQAWAEIIHNVKSSSPWLVAGALATNDIDILRHFNSTNLNPGWVGTPDKKLHCLAGGFTLSSAQHAAKGMLVIDRKPAPAKASGNVPPPAEPASKRQRAENDRVIGRKHPHAETHDFLKALHDAVKDGHKWPEDLLAHKRECWTDEHDGCAMVEAATREQCEQKLEVAFAVIAAARSQAGVDSPDEALDEDEMDRAMDWLKDLHKEKFMTWPDLPQALHDRETGQRAFSRKEKAQMKQHKRSAFRAFCKDVFGSLPMATILLRYGHRKPAELTSLLQELATAKENVAAEREANPPKTAKSHPKLAQDAHKARADYSWGRRLAEQVEKGTQRSALTSLEQALLSDFETGVLREKKSRPTRRLVTEKALTTR